VIACCDLDRLIPKTKQHIYEPKYISDQNRVEFPSLVLRYGVHKVLGQRLLWPLTF